MTNEFMNEAIALARQSEFEGEVPVGAVVVKDNKIVGAANTAKMRFITPSWRQ